MVGAQNGTILESFQVYFIAHPGVSQGLLERLLRVRCHLAQPTYL
jgi:hypothetical protein